MPAIDVTGFWTEPPPKPSEGLKKWMDKIRDGWRPNRRIRSLGYHEAAEFYGVYIWEYINVIGPAI